ncbi:hypothetical protein OIE71_04715 [Streptomyces sp. NBC_01725]|uniref:phage terminase small subunit n=1 Tax=Streptomyces sp. NBC_01725 TaxID=2975923 RepID=UPI002E288B9B|nr:hypothetical protein [Streptomyces sp. NBC_01725]
MAGNGPAPKSNDRKARRNKDSIPQTVLRWEAAAAPELPDFRIDKDGDLVEFVWPERTREWWQTWIDSPQAEHFGTTDWEYLLDTALIHAQMWRGNLTAAGELRLRVAAFGATPADRARLRMVFAEADGLDGGRGSSGGPSARERYGAAKLRSLPGGKSADE